MLRGQDLIVWLSSIGSRERDRAVEDLLGLDPSLEEAPVPVSDVCSDFGGEASDLVGYHGSGIAALARAALEVPMFPEDVVVDLGSGLGKAAFVLHLLSGARVHGAERDRRLVLAANAARDRLGLHAVTFEHIDARAARLDEGTIFYLYLPFTGDVLAGMLEALRDAAQKRPIVVVTLGLDLGRVPWLVARETDAFWLAIYDSRCPGVAPGAVRRPCSLSWAADVVIHERDQAPL
jgi:hypothetical protein